MAGEVLRVDSRVHLDWSHPDHWDAVKKLPCRLGDGPTQQRDSQGLPCHKSCAEKELAAERTRTKDGRITNERYSPASDTRIGGAK